MTNTLFVDRYRLIRQIGSGGMGVVFEAEDQLLKKTVAIKTIKKGALGPDLVMRFQREANALAALNHPNLVPIYIFGITDDNQPYLVMRYEQGKPLSELIESRGRLPLYKSINIFLKLASAIEHAHGHGVLHRDLKPSNVILNNYEGENPDVVLIDFGIAMVATNNSMDSLTKTGILLGTPAYMSPEQIGGRELDERSDIYSLGCIMYETLTGLQPFSASSALELLAKKSTQTAPSINDAFMDASFPEAITAITAKCLATSPSARYESAEALKADLQSFKSGDFKPDAARASHEAQPKYTSATMPPRAPLRKSAASVSGVLLITLCTGGLGLVVFLTAMYLTEPNSDSAPQKDAQNPRIAKDFGFGSEPFSFRDGTLYVGGLLGSNVDTDALVSEKIKSVAAEETKHGRELSTVCLEGTDVSGSCFEGCENIPIEEIAATDVNFTDDGLKAISKLKDLDELKIERGDKFTARGINYLANVPRLTRLHIIDGDITKSEARAIANLHQLTELDLRGGHGVDDEAVALIAKNVPNLRYLGLNATQVSAKGLESLAQLQHLEQLLLRQTRLTIEGMVALSHLKHLVTLDVKSNDNLTDAHIAPLKSLSTLGELNIDSPEISSLALANLKLSNPQLKTNTERAHSTLLSSTEEGSQSKEQTPDANYEELQIPLHRSDTEVALLLKSEAAKPSPPKSVRAAGSDITGECFQDCRLAMVSLKCCDNKLTRNGLQAIGRLRTLRYLGLRDEFLITDGLRFLEHSPALQNIAIGECRLSARSLEGLGSNNNVQTLYIRECTDTNIGSKDSFLGDDALQALARGGSKSLTKLSWMRMATPSSGTLQCLKKFPNLKALKLSWLGLNNGHLKDLLDLNLEILDITNNNAIDFEGLKLLQRMKHLKKLRLGEHFSAPELRERLPGLAAKVVIESALTAKTVEQKFDLNHF